MKELEIRWQQSGDVEAWLSHKKLERRFVIVRSLSSRDFIICDRRYSTFAKAVEYAESEMMKYAECEMRKDSVKDFVVIINREGIRELLERATKGFQLI
jgi:hypothetical protein